MNENVMSYEIKSSSNSNSKILFSENKEYFYWNHSKFKNLEIGDIVFVVNTHSNWVLYTELEKIDIPTTFTGTHSIFTDNNETFTVEGEWQQFIRLKILELINTPKDWKWKSFGSSENAYFYGDNINTATSKNRLLNIEQFRALPINEEIKDILNKCENSFIVNGNNDIIHVPKFQRPSNNTFDKMNILTAIQTKPFILLAGISGTGKSRLVRTLAYKTCNDKDLRTNPMKPGNFELIPVRPNWHDSSELMGYVSRIAGEKYITTAFIRFIAKAWKYPDTPFFLCLDEMNLAPVEHYFAEYLSIIETRQWHYDKERVISDYLIAKDSFENDQLYNELIEELELDGDSNFKEGIGIPENLVIIGTVNMDETTHSFSRKVLDRAMTFEMNDVDLYAGLNSEESDWSYPNDNEYIPYDKIIGTYTAGNEVFEEYDKSDDVIKFLEDLNSHLEGTAFKIAYRVRDEFLIYCFHASQSSNNKNSTNWLTTALDEMTSMKVLSRIEGDEARTGTVLTNLQKVITRDYPISNAKLLEMEERLKLNGYTSFWT